MTVTSSIPATRENNATFDSRRITELEGRVAEARRQFTALEIDFQNSQADVVAKNREIGRLKAEITKREQSSTTMIEVRAVWDHFVAVVVRQKAAVTLGDGRKKMIRDRIRELREAGCEDPVAKLKRAADGLAARPYVRNGGGRTGDPKNAKRYALPSHCFGSDERVEMAIGWLEPDTPKPTPIRRDRQPDPFDRPVDRVLTALTQHDCSYRAAWSGDGQVRGGAWMAQCPAHEDREPSLSIREASDRVLLNCFASCHIVDVVEALGLNLSDLFVRSAA